MRKPYLLDMSLLLGVLTIVGLSALIAWGFATVTALCLAAAELV